MRSVRFNFLLIFFLIFGLSYRGHADCPWNVPSNTDLESFFAGWGEWRKEIKVVAIKDQGVDGYFNPKIRVCAYDGKSYCYDLKSGESCRQIYGIQSTGGGISAAAFIDWEGDRMLADGTIKIDSSKKIKEGIAKDLRWEWADDVTAEEKVKFANSPKICACSQKGACMSGISSWGARAFSGENIFRPRDMEKACDTCYQKVIKCAPIPLAPGPSPFCEQLAMSPPQVRIVPIRNQDNDYFNPKVKVIAGDLIGKDGEIEKKLNFPRKYKKNKAGKSPTPDEVKKDSILDKDGTTHYFATYKEKDKLCAEYRGTEREESKRKLQFPARCFPAPPAPELEEVEIVDENTLKIRMKMSRETCSPLNDRAYSDGLCTFNVYTNRPTNIGPLSLTVVKPAIVEKTAGGDNSQGNIDNIIEGVLKNNSQFEVLKKYDFVPDIMVGCSGSKDFYSLQDFNEEKLKKCKSDNLGQPEIEVKYNDNPKSKMLCLSGWKPEPEEFTLKRGNEIIPLKLMGTKYAQYNTVYSEESNRSYYFPCKEKENNKLVDILAKSQEDLDELIFNKQGYVFFSDENKYRDNCIAKKDDKVDTKQDCNKCKIVYELIDGKREEKGCKQDDDGCICFNEVCSRSTQYLNKKDEPFYLKISQEQNGVVKQLEQPIKANRTEVFYADKLCRLDLKNVRKGVLEVIKKRLKNKNPSLPTKLYKFSGNNDYTDDLSQYDYIEVEAWGGGEAGHIKDKAYSPGNMLGMPGDYVRAKLKIDPNHSVIRVEVGEEGGKQEDDMLNKNGKPTLVEMCDSYKQNCLPLITVRGGGNFTKDRSIETEVRAENLELIRIVRSKAHAASLLEKDKQIAYIENGKIKYETVKCSSGFRSNKHGAGGCIDRNSQTYGRGSPGYVKISAVKTDYEEIDYEKVNKEVDEIIDALLKNPGSNPDISNLIKKLYPGITEEIKDEIEKELLGSVPKDSKS